MHCTGPRYPSKRQVHKLALLETHPPFAWKPIQIHRFYQPEDQFLAQLLYVLAHLI